MVDGPRKLTDDEFSAALNDLEEGRVPFNAPDMLRRFGATIVFKLWEASNDKGGPQISS
jgi:hypothetical protein